MNISVIINQDDSKNSIKKCAKDCNGTYNKGDQTTDSLISMSFTFEKKEDADKFATEVEKLFVEDVIKYY